MNELFKKDIDGDDVKIIITPRESWASTIPSVVDCTVYYKAPRKWYQREGKYEFIYRNSEWLTQITDWGCKELTEWAEKTLEDHNNKILRLREKDKVLEIIEKGCK